MTIDATWYQRPPGIRERIAAGGIVARREGGCVFIALAREKGISSFVLPKGGVDAGESLEQAARREIAEETGLTDLQFVRALGARERLLYDKTAWSVVYYFLFTTTQITAVPTDTKYHAEMRWCPIDDLPAFLWPEQQALVQDHAAEIKLTLG